MASRSYKGLFKKCKDKVQTPRKSISKILTIEQEYVMLIYHQMADALQLIRQQQRGYTWIIVLIFPLNINVLVKINSMSDSTSIATLTKNCLGTNIPRQSPACYPKKLSQDKINLQYLLTVTSLHHTVHLVQTSMTLT